MHGLRNKGIRLAGLSLLALATWWLLHNASREPARAPSETDNLPDYVIEAFSATVMNPQGNKKYVLQATRLEHYPGANKAVLQQPHLIQYKNGRDPIHTHAERGELDERSKHLVMLGKVRISQSGGAEHGASLITTDRLDIALE